MSEKLQTKLDILIVLGVYIFSAYVMLGLL